MSDIYFADNIAYLKEGRAMVVESNGTARVKRGASVKASTPATTNNAPPVFLLSGNVEKIAYWGDNNMFPQDIIALASKSTELPSLLDWKARAAHGSETLPYNREFNPATKQWEDVPITDADIVSFFTNERTKMYFREAWLDFYWFANVFTDLIKNEAGDQIAYIGTHDASWCRWYKMDDNGNIPTCAVSSAWGSVAQKGTIYWQEHPVVNPYQWDLADSLKGDNTIKRFVYPLSFPSPGRAYYQSATWDGIRTSGWLELAAKIPQFKQAIMQNQMHIKYLIRIPTNYWASAYPLWESYSEEIKISKKREKLDEINKQLSNVENAGKSILNEVGYDVNGEKLPGWDIEVIDDKLKDGAYVEDSQEVSSHLLRALGLDGTLVGQGPGRNLNAGGGSDKLIAFNMYCALLESHRDIVNQPLYFIAQYNGWADRYPFFKIKTTNASPQALDTSRRVSQTVQDQWPPKDSSTQQ